MKKFLALLLAAMMVLSAVPAMADETSQHTITIDNNDQYVSHSYEAYQVFVGKLDAGQTKLSDIVWGSGVNGTTLLAALKADTTYGNKFTNCNSAADVAKVLDSNDFASTTGADVAAGAIDHIASIINEHLSTTKATFTEADSGKTYTASVIGDGYYFIKDVTATATLNGTNGSDTKSKFLLAVVKNTTVYAKDQGLKPDKEILITEGKESAADYERVKENTAAVGDLVTFEVSIDVPNTKKYIDHFIFDMKDTLPDGMTFMGITSVKVGADDVPYTLTVAPSGSDDYATYTAPADAAAAVTTAGGQKIKVVFNNFKSNAESKNWIGKELIVTYTAVINDDADFTPTGNQNEVYFDYSNDPNHDYDGDEPDDDEPMGETPKDRTKHLLINLELLKTGDDAAVAALAGAEFEITSDDYNVTLVTGEKFVAADYTLLTGETLVSEGWYKLRDGSYTQTTPTDQTSSSYESTSVTYKKVSFSDSNTTPGETKKVTVITGEDGKIVLRGLKPGTYTLKETKAPTGYNLDTNTYTIKINWDKENKVFVKDSSSSESVTWTANTATATITIDNKGGATLPSTGGIGTTLFYAGGAILVLLAGILLVSKRRAA